MPECVFNLDDKCGHTGYGACALPKSEAQFLSAIRSIKVKGLVEGTIHHRPAVIAILTALLWMSVESNIARTSIDSVLSGVE